MHKLRHHFEQIFGKQLPAVFLSICVAVSGAALIITPNVRLAENIDSGPLNERNEQLSHAERFSIDKRLRNDAEPSRFAVAKISNVLRLQFQCTGQHSPDGHRLSNGLLAPLTC